MMLTNKANMIHCKVRFVTTKMCVLPQINFPHPGVAKIIIATFFFFLKWNIKSPSKRIIGKQG